MNILDEIIASKYEEVAHRKQLHPAKALEKSEYFTKKAYSFSGALTKPGQFGIISEFKRQSPSKGVINGEADVQTVTSGYAKAGAAALSVLTDVKYFGGSCNDLIAAREVNACPILRKEFIVDEYQLLEAKSMGADVILLIAAALEPKRLKELAAFARSLGLEVLMEVHNEEELMANLHEEINVIGVNNRNLKTFEVSIQTSIDLVDKIPDSYVKISESGINDPQNIVKLWQAGFRGFLIGENFMKTSTPEKACAEFIGQLKTLINA